MGKFIGRLKELGSLTDACENSMYKAVAVIGRRRVGKTYLIEEFIKDKEHIYIQFIDSYHSTNLEHMGLCLKNKFGKEFKFKNSIEFFDTLAELIRGKRYIIVFDEYPFISEKDDSFSSLLQNFIDHDIGESRVIISGSSISMMDQEIADYSRPLFGRVHRFIVKPMKISECIDFHPKMSKEDQMRMYLTFGGIPLYYDTPSVDTYRKYLIKYLLSENSALNMEGSSIIRREFSSGEEYNEILDSIASNNNSVAEISVMTGFDRSTIRHHLDRMIELELIESIHTMAGSNTRPERYRIKDRMLAFYHYIIRRSQITYPSSGPDYNSVKNMISTFHERMFEQQCADYLKEHYVVKEIGSWYGSIPLKDKGGMVMKDDSGKARTESTDIDIVAYVYKDGNMLELYGECKFTDEPIGFKEFNKLRTRMSYAHVGANNRMIFFSRSGFQTNFREYAEETGIILVDIDDMLS